MSRTCTVCSHPERQRIDAQLLEGVPNTTIAANTGVSEQAVRRHGKSHLPKFEVQARTEMREYDHHRKLKILEKSLYTILKRSLEDGDDPMALRTHGSLLKHYAFELQLGEIEAIRRELAELTEMIREREESR